MTDEELVDRSLHGDTAAFALLVERHKASIYNLAAKMVGNPADAEDVAQEAFIQIYRALATYRGQSRFSTWAYRIAVNRCLDFQRRQNPVRRASSLDGDRSDGAGPGLHLRSPEPGPEEQLLEAERQARVRRLLAELPDHYRVVLTLYHYQNLSYQEIGEVLDLPVRTVETRLYRAKQMLKQQLLNAKEGGARHALSGRAGAVAPLP